MANRPSKPTFQDYLISIIHAFFIVTSILASVFRQNTWRWLFNMREYNEFHVVRKNAGVLLERVTAPLPKGTLDSEEEVKLRKASKALNGILQVNIVMENWLWKFNPFWKRIIEYECPVELYNSRSFLFMGNHSSYCDVLSTCALGFNFATVGMASLQEVPIGGRMLRNSGFLPVHFVKKSNGKWGTDAAKTREMIQQSVDYLQNGLSVWIFPEGNINTGHELADFKPGFFTVGRTVGVDLIPVAIQGATKAWPMASKSTPRWPMSSGTIFIKVGSPMKQLSTTEISVLNFEEDIRSYLEKEYKIDFSNGQAVTDFGGIIGEIAELNKSEKSGGEDYEKNIGDLFRFVVKKKIFEMKLDLIEKEKRYNQL